MGNHIKSLNPLFITKLGYHLMIFGCTWMKKYGVLLDIINDSIIFLPEYYTQFGVLSFPVFLILIIKTKIITIVIKKDVLSDQILKKDLVNKINKFLKIAKEML